MYEIPLGASNIYELPPPAAEKTAAIKRALFYRQAKKRKGEGVGERQSLYTDFTRLLASAFSRCGESAEIKRGR